MNYFLPSLPEKKKKKKVLSPDFSIAQSIDSFLSKNHI